MSKTGRVYKMWFRDEPNNLYVGSTVQTLARRMELHKRAARHSNEKSYWVNHMRSQDLSLLRIELLEEIKFNNKNELLIAEDRYILNLKPKFNMKKACWTEEERKAYHKEYHKTPKMKTYKKEYYAKPEIKLQKKTLKQRYINEEKYKCINCNKCFDCTSKLNNHFKTKIHKTVFTQAAINEFQNLTNQKLFN